MLYILNSPRFAHCALAVIYAQLLDESRYVASVRTMYRLLQDCAATRERRDRLRHPIAAGGFRARSVGAGSRFVSSLGARRKAGERSYPGRPCRPAINGAGTVARR